MSKKINIIVIVLACLLVLSVGYIVYGIYSEAKLQEQMAIYQDGAQDGYIQAISQMHQAASPPNCQQVPLTFSNQTINIFAVECIPQQAQ